MTHRMDGKIAVVTGGSRGLGNVIADALADGGAHVAVLARPSAELAAMAERDDGRIVAIACDVADAASVAAAFAAVEDRFGRLDVLVNNAAIAQLNRIADIPPEALTREIAINLTGPILCARSAIPLMRASGSGHIVNISSQSVRLHMPFLTIYSTTKAGLEVFSAALRAEVSGDGIRVTTLRLGGVTGGKGLTRLWEREKKQAYLSAARESGMLDAAGGWMEPGSVAAMLMHLLTVPADVSPEFVEMAGR